MTIRNTLIVIALVLLLATAVFGGVKMQCGPVNDGTTVCIWTLVVKKLPAP